VGRIEKQVAEGMIKYYWYPGDKREWKRAAIALGIGLAAFLMLFMLTRDLLPAVVGATSVTAAVSGLNFGRRDARAITSFPNPTGRATRIAAIGHTGRAAWRGLVHGLGGAAAAVLILQHALDTERTTGRPPGEPDGRRCRLIRPRAARPSRAPPARRGSPAERPAPEVPCARARAAPSRTAAGDTAPRTR